MNSITLSLVVVSTALALSACSEELSTQAKKAAAEIAVEANKAATQKIRASKKRCYWSVEKFESRNRGQER